MGRARKYSELHERNLLNWRFVWRCPNCRRQTIWLVSERPVRDTGEKVIARCSHCTFLKEVTEEHRSRQYGETVVGGEVRAW